MLVLLVQTWMAWGVRSRNPRRRRGTFKSQLRSTGKLARLARGGRDSTRPPTSHTVLVSIQISSYKLINTTRRGPALHVHAPDPISRGTFRCSPWRRERTGWCPVRSSTCARVVAVADRSRRRDGGTSGCVTTAVRSKGKAPAFGKKQRSRHVSLQSFF
jgi:hypothetical protein